MTRAWACSWQPSASSFVRGGPELCLPWVLMPPHGAAQPGRCRSTATSPSLRCSLRPIRASLAVTNFVDGKAIFGSASLQLTHQVGERTSLDGGPDLCHEV